ncbi:MAG: arylsulfatase [Planctomycetota bacterium]
MRNFLLAITIMATGGSACPGQTSPPNVVLILADDMGYGDVTCYDPKSQIQTPNLDRLASEGVRFTDAHTASGVCTPSRYALLTGRYAWRTRLKQGVFGGFSPPLIDADRLTLAELFRDAGFRTACVGKWHLGMDWPEASGAEPNGAASNDGTAIDFLQPITNGPLAHGFDRFFGISASLDMPPYVFISQDRVTEMPTSLHSREDKGGREGPAVPGWRHRRVLGRLGDETVAFIEAHADVPFFAYMPLNAPHTPHAPSADFQGKSGLDTYGDFMVEVDYTIGRVLSTLDRLNLTDNTLIIVTSDNGPEVNMFPRLRKTGHDSSSHWLGCKRDNWEGGHRVPFLVRWPGVVKPESVCESPIGLVDCLATFAELLETDLSESQAVDSVSFLPLMRGDSSAYRDNHALIHHSSSGRFAIRLGKWKLLLHPGSGGNAYGNPGRAKLFAGTPEFAAAAVGRPQLYDLSTDPDETQNVAGEHPDVVQHLTQLAAGYIRRGRSTPGPEMAQVQNADWKQLDWLPAAAGAAAPTGAAGRSPNPCGQ